MSTTLLLLLVAAGVVLGFVAGRVGRHPPPADPGDESELSRRRAELDERLAQLERLRHDFVTTASHELRTPLTVIKAASELLEARWDSLTEGQRREFVRQIRRYGGALESLVDRVLEFQELRTRERAIVVRPVALDRLLWELVDGMPGLYHGHLVTWQLEPELTVVADPDLLRRVFEALVDNAVRHTPEGTRIEITARSDGAEGLIVVRDDGPGIAPEDREDIVAVGRRGGDVLTRPTGGLGLGLALAHEVLAAHGSELEIDLDVRRGTEFRFRLPLAPPEVRQARRTGRQGFRDLTGEFPTIQRAST